MKKFAGSQVRRFSGSQVQGSRFKGLELGTWNLEPIRRFAVVGVGLILLFLATTPASAQNMITLFDLDSGARSLAMGGAFAGLSDDQNAVFYNPAGLAYLGIETSLSSFYESHFGLTDYGQIAVATSKMGMGVLLFNSRPIVQRDEQGNNVGQFSYSTVGLAGAYGTTLGELPFDMGIPAGLERLALGARLKLYRVKTLQEGSGVTLALDPALMFDFGKLEAGGVELEYVRLGLVLENLLGKAMEFGSGHREPWPLGLRFGSSVAFRELIVAADLESKGTFHLGGEYRFPGIGVEGLGEGDLALRTGLVLGQRASFNLGLGFKLKNFRIDYALATHPQLPISHLLSFTVAFNLDP
jgi:hypothetical protein